VLIQDETKFAEDLTAKEKAQPTAIGKGIAIPHIMLPHLDRSYIVIALFTAIASGFVDNLPIIANNDWFLRKYGRLIGL